MSQNSPSFSEANASGLKVAIVAARFNETHVDALLEGILEAFSGMGLDRELVRVERVPGAVEVPVVCKWLAETGDYDALIGLGTIIKGGTMHYELVANASSDGLQEVALKTGVPVINGILVGDNEEQIRVRCHGDTSKAREFAPTAIEMAQLRKKIIQEG